MQRKNIRVRSLLWGKMKRRTKRQPKYEEGVKIHKLTQVRLPVVVAAGCLAAWGFGIAWGDWPAGLRYWYSGSSMSLGIPDLFSMMYVAESTLRREHCEAFPYWRGAGIWASRLIPDIYCGSN